ncbi:shikimate dehydrogenase family protein [Chryseobacterium sp. MFBS3-17]|uniref:shikimate dehydrogenase family protein n=1 Tax=Chryseobacterium sp. MFBS3-17 TaxID=2886689 RepID=UPI001D0EF77A|nr:shikimate dehydrogenase [Chryseobacterium sp. MFBS3-17]MCC2590975.1 shikimate dehydrogenase [Chryseobacterium sp. MFBS3-17]
MNAALKFGLIGKDIAYSFSKKYFQDKFQRLMLHDHSYEIYDLKNIEKVLPILQTPDLRGLNVTIPYKEAIIPYLDALSSEAEKIGAVNTIVIKDGKKTGYNTDAPGFEKCFLKFRKQRHQSALILGNGGAAKAVQYVFQQSGIPYKTVYRKGEITFENLSPEDVSKHLVVIQCTPVGTFPGVTDCVPFPFEALTPEHLVIDLIYNPAETQFIKNAYSRGAKTYNGLFMLENQAEKAWELWQK